MAAKYWSRLHRKVVELPSLGGIEMMCDMALEDIVAYLAVLG